MKRSVELVASIPNKKVFDGVDFDAFDGAYLGQPYCLKYQGNFLVNPDDLKIAIGVLHGQGKKAYLTTPAVPKGKELPAIVKTIKVAAGAGIDAVEAHDVGVFRRLRNDFPSVKVHVGNFANVYNENSAALYGRLGASRIVPSHELTGEELALIAKVEGVEFERPVHGPLPLGMAYACLLRRTGDGDELGPCRQQCAREHFMELDGWRMRSVGTSLLMGEDYSLIEHIGGLLDMGLAALRLETYFDPADKINALGKVYRQALVGALAGREGDPAQLAGVRAVSTAGLCNGWHFGRSGREYVGAGEASV